MLRNLLLSLVLCHLCYSQACLNHKKQKVDWFLVINLPQFKGKEVSGHLYFDSTFKTTNFKFYQTNSDEGGPIYNTLSSFNNEGVKFLTWNDGFDKNNSVVYKKGKKPQDLCQSLEKKQPKNSKQSSCKDQGTIKPAHAKSVIAYSQDYGVIVDHSLPQFPVIKNNKINPQIPSGKRKYGQHFLCISTTPQTAKEILLKSKITKPYYYPIKNQAQKSSIDKCEKFEYSQFQIGKSKSQTPVKVIFKNGNLISSIFQDGLTNLLKSDILAQTWGRPYQIASCKAKYKVNNIQELSYNSQIKWKNTKDHSKWAISASPETYFSCFGDMNRMTSQCTRGGAFYCLQHTNLRNALEKLITKIEGCS